MRKIEGSAGKQAALWVLRLRENWMSSYDEPDDRDCDSLAYRQLLGL